MGHLLTQLQRRGAAKDDFPDRSDEKIHQVCCDKKTRVQFSFSKSFQFHSAIEADGIQSQPKLGRDDVAEATPAGNKRRYCRASLTVTVTSWLSSERSVLYQQHSAIRNGPLHRAAAVLHSLRNHRNVLGSLRRKGESSLISSNQSIFRSRKQRTWTK